MKLKISSFLLCLFMAVSFVHATAMNMKSPTLYYSSHCPYSRQVLNYLKDHPRSIVLKDVTQDAAAKVELSEKGGFLQVPCLIIDNLAIYQSGPIIEWLEDHANE